MLTQTGAAPQTGAVHGGAEELDMGTPWCVDVPERKPAQRFVAQEMGARGRRAMKRFAASVMGVQKLCLRNKDLVFYGKREVYYTWTRDGRTNSSV